MSQFFVSISNDEIAEQIATLLNTFNLLRVTHTKDTIKSGIANYFVEIIKSKVIGCAALNRDMQYDDLSKIKHVCVHPEYRRLGVARKLITLAINHATTTYVYMTIRQANRASQSLAYKMNFNKINYPNPHNLCIMGRRRNV